MIRSRATLAPVSLTALIGFGCCAIAACIGVDPDVVSSEKPAADKAPSDTTPASSEAGATDATSGADDAGGLDANAACAPIAGNLLDNPSFELGGAAWYISSSADSRSDDASDCKKFLAVDFSEHWDAIRQYFDLSSLVTSSDGGEMVALDFGVSLRSLDDVAEPALIGIQNDDSGFDATYIRSKSLPPGEWVTVSGTALVSPRANFYFSVANEEYTRKLGIDRAWVVLHH